MVYKEEEVKQVPETGLLHPVPAGEPVAARH